MARAIDWSVVVRTVLYTSIGKCPHTNTTIDIYRNVSTLGSAHCCAEKGILIFCSWCFEFSRVFFSLEISPAHQCYIIIYYLNWCLSSGSIAATGEVPLMMTLVFLSSVSLSLSHTHSIYLFLLCCCFIHTISAKYKIVCLLFDSRFHFFSSLMLFISLFFCAISFLMLRCFDLLMPWICCCSTYYFFWFLIFRLLFCFLCFICRNRSR